MQPARFHSALKVNGRFRCVDCGDDQGPAEGRSRPWCWECGYFRYRCLSRVQAAASARLNKAIRQGVLPAVTTLACADCGSPAVCYDHRDYTKPLAVDPVCKSCNAFRGSADDWGELPERIVRPPAFGRLCVARANEGVAIRCVVTHIGSAAEVARLIDVPQQHVQAWVRRGWAAPTHALALEPLLPEGLTLRDLLQDHKAAQSSKALAAA